VSPSGARHLARSSGSLEHVFTQSRRATLGTEFARARLQANPPPDNDEAVVNFRFLMAPQVSRRDEPRVFPEGFEGFVQRASRSSDKDLAMDFTVRDLVAERRRSRRQAGRPRPILTPPPVASLCAICLAYKNFRFLRSPRYERSSRALTTQSAFRWPLVVRVSGQPPEGGDDRDGRSLRRSRGRPIFRLDAIAVCSPNCDRGILRKCDLALSSPLQFASWREKPNHGNIHVTMNALDALGNPTRREILNELRRAPMPVGALARRFAVSRPAISRHLRVLQNAGLVSPEDRGTQNVYAVRVQGFRAVREYIDSFWDVALSQLEELA